MTTNNLTQKLQYCLFSLRLGVFVVMLMWTLDKFINPQHAAAVFNNFYLIEGLGPAVFTVLATLELILILGFMSGLFKKWTYGLVLLLHAVSTLSAWQQYLGFGNLLFFAAWPMLAACWTLFMLREEDTLFTLGSGVEEPDALPYSQ
ncbi:MAG: hypothetical protein PsegKO_28010 [Pseudohongiellaceae bacterium]|jgi:hypothetical protein